LREVEVEHLKTTIISLHEEFKVVEDLHKDVRNLRDKEENHRAGAALLTQYITGELAASEKEQEEENDRFEAALDSEN
jgi:hypothetical protein